LGEFLALSIKNKNKNKNYIVSPHSYITAMPLPCSLKNQGRRNTEALSHTSAEMHTKSDLNSNHILTNPNFAIN